MAGLALIVANHSVTNSRIIATGKQLRNLFKRVLKFDTHFFENQTEPDINRLLTCGSNYPYDMGMKMVFYFVGHGGKDFIQVKDGTIDINKNILDLFQPSNNPTICNIPKLFFFDCCRGCGDDGLVEVPPQAMEVHPSKGNMLVAYSTHYTYKSFESEVTLGPVQYGLIT